jgi:hypothetical protein
MAEIGSALSQPPITLINTAGALTQKHFQKTLVDSVFKPSPMFWRLTRLGRKFTGGSLVWPLINQEELTGGAYWGAQLLSTDVTDSIQPAELQWKAYQQLIAIPVLDAVLNQGMQAVANLVRSKEEVAFGSLLQKLNRAVQRIAPQNTAIDLDGVPIALADTGAYAGVPIQSNAVTGFVWRTNGGNGVTAAPAGGITLPNLQTDYGRATYGNEEPTLIATTQAGYNTYWGLLTNNQRFIEDEETTRGGFRNLMFNRAVVLHDQFVPSGELQMYTEKYVRPVFHPFDHFRIDPFIQPTNQRVIVSHVWLTMNLQFLSLRQHARQTGLANA